MPNHKAHSLSTFIFTFLSLVSPANYTSNAHFSCYASLHHYFIILADSSTNITYQSVSLHYGYSFLSRYPSSSLGILHIHLFLLPTVFNFQTEVFRNHLNSSCSPWMTHLLALARIHWSAKSSTWKTTAAFVTLSNHQSDNVYKPQPKTCNFYAGQNTLNTSESTLQSGTVFSISDVLCKLEYKS